MNIKALFTMILILCIVPARADLLVIVNSKNSMESLERKQVIDIFMGRTSHFPNRIPVRALDVTGENNLRATFYKSLTGKSEAQVDAYWATLIFAGRMTPPEKLVSETDVIKLVARDTRAIGYISKQKLSSNIKVVMEIETQE